MMDKPVKKQNVVVVVPTVRPEVFDEFKRRWDGLLKAHSAKLVAVFDGDGPRVVGESYEEGNPYKSAAVTLTPEDVVPYCWEFLSRKTDAVRNIGFLAAMKLWPDTGIILTLDDDVYPEPDSDPIADHLKALEMNVPTSWFSTASEYMRGFPYGVRSESPVVVSHGVWSGVHDYDGPTQLVLGVRPATFYKGPVPSGCLTPVCGMNLAFKTSVLPWVYFAPMAGDTGFQRFADIWMGIVLKRHLDSCGLAMVSGYSRVFHSRASNVFANLRQEAAGIELNEKMWSQSAMSGDLEHPYLRHWAVKRELWRKVAEGFLAHE